MFPLVVFSVAVILAVFSLLTSKSSLNSGGAEVRPQINLKDIPVIQNADELNDVDSELVNIDLGEFDKQLNQLEIDASTF